MIGFGIFLGEHMCYTEKKHMFAICYTKPFAEGYAKDLSDVFKIGYVAKKVKIEVLE